MTMIKDGTGDGYSAKVDDHNRLYVVANEVSHLAHHATYHENAFFMTFNTVLPDTSETPVMVIENADSTLDFEVYPVQISPDADIAVTWYKDSLYSSGGTVVTPVNTNFGSGVTLTVPAQAKAYEGGSSADLVLSTSSEKEFGTTYLSARQPFVHDFQGALVIQAGQSVAIKATGAAENNVNVSLILTHHPAGTKL